MERQAKRRVQGILGAIVVALLVGFSGTVWADDAINFPPTPVGSTRTVQFTYTLTATSETSATVTIAPPGAPFGIVGSLQFTLSPGQSRTFGVTFSPSSPGDASGAFTITAVGGFPPQTRTEWISLTGTGTGEGGTETTTVPWTDLFGGLFGEQPMEVVPPEDERIEAKLDSLAAAMDGFVWQMGESDVQRALLEVKLDDMGRVLEEFRHKLDNLGYWLGELTVGWGIGIEPYSTNPEVETSLWEILQRLETKLDRMGAAPTDVTIIDVYTLIVDIQVVIVQINQWIIDFGGDVDGLEAKLDQLAIDLGMLWMDLLDLSVEIDDLQSDLSDLSDDVFDLSLDVLDNYLEILNNGADIQQNNVDILANNAAIAANAAAINSLAGTVRSVLTSNHRIEDKLNQLLGYPVAPDASKIALTTGGGPLPAIPWTATVTARAGAVAPGAQVTIYWPLGMPSTLTAAPDGSFQKTVDSGSAAYLSVEITQTDGQGRESARAVVWGGP